MNTTASHPALPVHPSLFAGVDDDLDDLFIDDDDDLDDDLDDDDDFDDDDDLDDDDDF